MATHAAHAGLILEDIRHSYDGTPVLHGIDLSVGRGELVCLLGPSGCGKTTTLRIAAGLEAIQHGRVCIGDTEVALPGRSLPPERRNVGLMFQDYALFPHLKVIDNVAFGLRDKKPSERRSMACELLSHVGAERHANDFPHVLSGGEQQRVALARALAPRPSVMLLDEPFSGLDRRLRDAVRDDTLHLLKGADMATLLVTHDAEEAMFMADRIALMRDGRIVQAGTAEELYRAPNSPFVAAFFSDLNEFYGVVKGGSVETPIGSVAAKFGEGVAVRVMIRPEALRLVDGEKIDQSVLATVDERHLLGPASLLRLKVDGATDRLVMRVSGKHVPAAGDSVRIRLDRDQSFVFPASQKSSE